MPNIKQLIAIVLLRPYISRELPGWGKLYNVLIGDYGSDHLWKECGQHWVKGKLHGYEMLLDLGYWANRQTYFLKRFYDLPTQLLMMEKLKPGDTFLDVGANEGMMSLLASKIVGPSGRVIAFEPNPAPRAIFENNIARNRISNISVRPVALGATKARMTLHIPKINAGEGSLSRPNYEEKDLTALEVDVANGDAVLSNEVPALVKIDVEGFELEVLQGIETVLHRCKPLVITEIVPAHLRRVGASPSAVADFMKCAGYSPWRLGLKSGALHLVNEWPKDDISADYVWLSNS